MVATRSWMFTVFSLRVIKPARVMVTTGISLADSFVPRTLGTSTSMPNSITCAVSMKITSSTSTTSTNGVTLISAREDEWPLRRDLGPSPPLREKAMAQTPLLLPETALGQVHELQRKIVHAGADLLDRVAEIVVENRRRYRGEKPHRRRDQRHRNARPDRLQTGRTHLPKLVEGLDDAHHGSHQPDERRDAGRGREPVHITFQLGEFLAD